MKHLNSYNHSEIEDKRQEDGIMDKKLIFLVAIIFLFYSVSLVSAVCTLSLSKAVYAPTETAVVTATCDAVNEKSQAYTINWTNSTGTQIQVNTGTTPATVGQLFTASYAIPASYVVTSKLYVNMTGTNLEGTASANVSGAAANSILISNIVNSGKYVGRVSSTSANIKTTGGKKISGAYCHIHVFNNLKTQVLFTAEDYSLDGDISFTGIATFGEFAEGIDYTNTIHCYCGPANITLERPCVDEDGNQVANLIGTSDSAFTMNTWATYQDNNPIVYSNGSTVPTNNVFYAGYGNRIYWQSNKTNNYALNPLTVKNEEFLINNATGLTAYPNEAQYSMKSGNESTTRVHSMEIPSSTPTGLYYIRQYSNVYYQDIFVAQYITQTATFNVTGTADSFQFQGVTMDKTNYYTGSQVNICANITSTYNTRVEFEISYRYRCGSATDSSQQSAIDSYTEIRGINPSTTQFRCANLDIPYTPVLAYKTSSCQAIVTIKSDYINTFDKKITLQGPTFNITDFGMYPDYNKDPSYPIVRLSPDWRRFDTLVDSVSKNYYRAKVNITQLSEANLDSNNTIGDADWDIYVLFTENMPCSTDIYNYTVLLANGSKTPRSLESKALQWVDRDGTEHKACSIGIENVNFSNTDDDYFEAYVWYEDFDERQTLALEGINISQALSSGALTQINSSLINMNSFLSSMNISNVNQANYLGGINSSLYSSSLYLWNINGSLVATSNYMNTINTSQFNAQSYLGALSSSATTSNGYLYSINGSLYLSRVALETIANKTGLFKLAIDCPSYATPGGIMDCLISAQIESSEAIEKEVSFKCYIDYNNLKYSAIDFNQMVTQEEIQLTKTFQIPAAFNLGSQYTVKCEAIYYNLGSRTDTFSDTFLTESAANGRWKEEIGTVGGFELPLGAIALGERIWPSSPKFGLVILLVLVFIIVLLFIRLARKKKKNETFK